ILFVTSLLLTPPLPSAVYPSSHLSPAGKLLSVLQSSSPADKQHRSVPMHLRYNPLSGASAPAPAPQKTLSYLPELRPRALRLCPPTLSYPLLPGCSPHLFSLLPSHRFPEGVLL